MTEFNRTRKEMYSVKLIPKKKRSYLSDLTIMLGKQCSRWTFKTLGTTVAIFVNRVTNIK